MKKLLGAPLPKGFSGIGAVNAEIISFIENDCRNSASWSDLARLNMTISAALKGISISEIMYRYILFNKYCRYSREYSQEYTLFSVAKAA